ncbi:hypothetical protein ACFWNK_34725 [Streptomyces sp. NPDC058417]|uniref:hypothetical protein n=1 Tax=unclassified Streptomyces TaxID=2593676 RepID=UPI0036699EE4
MCWAPSHIGDASLDVEVRRSVVVRRAAAVGRPARRYAEAAVEHAERCNPVVRARAWGRMATVLAAVGDTDGFRAATDRCRALLEHRRDDDPPSLYYFTPDQIAAEAGHALVELAAVTNRGRVRRLLDEATGLLSPLTSTGPDTGFPRSAFLPGIHLARAHHLAHDPEATAATLLLLADHLPRVQSIRCRHLLQSLRTAAGPRLRAQDGLRALTAVDRALSPA